MGESAAIGGPSAAGAHSAPRGAGDRVPRAHAQLRRTLLVAAVFYAAAASAWVARADSWLILHLFLAGGVVLTISGVSQMLTVTWSAAPAPAEGVAAVQRFAIALGAAGVALGRELDLGVAFLATVGASYVIGLVLLAVVLVATVRRGVQRRFVAAVAAYVAAIAAGLAGVSLGISMAVTSPTRPLRDAHATLNLLGLVGLVIAGTLPYFSATVGRSRMAPGATAAHLVVRTGVLASALALAVIGLLADSSVAAGSGLAAYAVGIGAVLVVLPRPTRRQLRWAGPRLVALWVGALWWATVVAVASAHSFAGSVTLFADRWLVTLVVAGYGQVLWGSFAYLLPVLRGGGHEQLSAGFTSTRSWPGLVAVNVAGLALLGDVTALAAVAIAVWVLDGAARAIVVASARRHGTGSNDRADAARDRH